jgi:hypothetical protein
VPVCRSLGSSGDAARRMFCARDHVDAECLLSEPDGRLVLPENEGSRRAVPVSLGSSGRVEVYRVRPLAAHKAAALSRNCQLWPGGDTVGVGVHGQQVQRVDRHGLPVGYIVLAGTSPAAVAAVRFAWGEPGKPDIFGTNGPAACDYSSLMVAA